jgi:hypothetical protein
MVLPVTSEYANVVHKTFKFLNSTEFRLHSFLGKVRRALDTHRESAVSVLAEGCYDGTQVFGLFIELERVELHRNVELGEEGIARVLGEDILDAWKRVDASMDHFV